MSVERLTKIQFDHALRLAHHSGHWWSRVQKLWNPHAPPLPEPALPWEAKLFEEREANAIDPETVLNLACAITSRPREFPFGVGLEVVNGRVVHASATRRIHWEVDAAGNVFITIQRALSGEKDLKFTNWNARRDRVRLVCYDLGRLREVVDQLHMGVDVEPPSRTDPPARIADIGSRHYHLPYHQIIEIIAQQFQHEELTRLVTVFRTTEGQSEKLAAKIALYEAMLRHQPAMVEQAKRELDEIPIDAHDVLRASIINDQITVERVGSHPILTRHVFALEDTLAGAMNDRQYMRPELIHIWGAVSDIHRVEAFFVRAVTHITNDLFHQRSLPGQPMTTKIGPKAFQQRVEDLYRRFQWIHMIHAQANPVQVEGEDEPSLLSY